MKRLLLILLLLPIPTFADVTVVSYSVGGAAAGGATAAGTNDFTGANSFLDSNWTLKDNSDTTKLLQFQLSGITTGTVRTLTVPNANITLAGLTAQTFGGIQTFSSEILISPGGELFFGGDGGTYNSISMLTQGTPDQTGLWAGTLSNSWHIGEFGDRVFDFNNGPCGTSACTTPSLIGHSAAQSTTQWWSLTHNGTDGVLDTGLGGLDLSGITGTYKWDRTITGAGTVGAQTINKTDGTVNFAAAATTLVVTNSLVAATSIVLGVLRTNDATCRLATIVPAAGSFTINMTGTCTAETSVGFSVRN